jgi:diacylglycerol kinase family enzyme
MDLILYNPKSKNSRGNIQTHRLVRKYKKEGKPFRLKSILKIKDIQKYLETRKDYDKVILLGGDGTINQFVNDTFDYAIKQDIYIKKNGSGNDFLRTLKHQDQKPQKIISNTLDNGTTHYFINGTGFGIDGLIIDYVDKAKNKGKLTYFLSSLRAMFQYVPEPLDVEIDGEKMHFKKAYLAVVNNGRFVGGGMEMTPKARIDDDNLDIMIVHNISKGMLLALFLTIYIGIHTKFTKYVFYRKCKHFKATFTTQQICQSDGEKYEDVTSIDVKSSNKSIHLRAY